MGVFTDIELEWGGKVFTIRGQRVMRVISLVEDVITMPELQAYSAKGTYPLAKLCTAFASVLRFAGACVTDEEVYEVAFSGEKEQEAVIMATMDLMKMMLPASARAKMEAAVADPDGAEAQAMEGASLGNSRATAQASSKKPTKRRSPKANG